jgi:hypothetical protein
MDTQSKTTTEKLASSAILTATAAIDRQVTQRWTKEDDKKIDRYQEREMK